MSIPSTQSYGLAIIYNMPVITRAQSKKSIVTPLELSVSSTNLINPLCGILNQLPDSKTTSLFQRSTSTGDPSLLESVDIVHSLSPPLSSSDQSNSFSTSNNLKISNLNRSSSFENSYSLQSSTLSHNSSISVFLKMEDDCDDTLKGSSPIPDLTDIARLLKSLTVQLTSQNNKLSDDFHHVMHTNDVFKQDTKMLLHSLRYIQSIYFPVYTII